MKVCSLLSWFCCSYSFDVKLRLFIRKKIATKITVNEEFTHFTSNGSIRPNVLSSNTSFFFVSKEYV